MVLPFGVLAEEAAAMKTGLSFTTDLSKSKDGQSQANIAITAVMADEKGVVTQCVIDVIQGKIAFDAIGKVTTDKATVFQSMQELGDGYNMRGASSIKAEWNEQANAFAAYCVGKTVEQLQAAELNDKNQVVDIVASCTLTVNEFLPGVLDAVAKAEHRGAKAGDVLKITDDGALSIDVEETERRRARILEKQKTLSNRFGLFSPVLFNNSDMK